MDEEEEQMAASSSTSEAAPSPASLSRFSFPPVQVLDESWLSHNDMLQEIIQHWTPRLFPTVFNVKVRPRGSGPCFLARPRIPPGELFSTCVDCGTSLAGFLTDHVVHAPRTVLLTCGHVVCPECLYKWKTIQRERTNGRDAYPLFKCQKCCQYVVEHFLPNRAEPEDSQCRGLMCPSGERDPATTFCNNCRIKLCSRCMNAHVSQPENSNHNVITIDTPSRPRANISKRQICCQKHNIPLKYRCLCGELQCAKCPTNYDSATTSGLLIPHCRVPLFEADLQLDEVMGDCPRMIKEMGQAADKLDKKREEIEANLEELCNEICVQMDMLMRMVMQRAWDMMNRVKEEAANHLTNLLKCSSRLRELTRRMKVALDIDERIRDPKLMDSEKGAELYRALAYCVFRPSVAGNESCVPTMGFARKFMRMKPILNVHFDTESVMKEIGAWGQIESNLDRFGPSEPITKPTPHTAPNTDTLKDGTVLPGIATHGLLKLGERSITGDTKHILREYEAECKKSVESGRPYANGTDGVKPFEIGGSLSRVVPTDKCHQPSSLHPIPRHSNSPAPSISVHGVPMAARQLHEHNKPLATPGSVARVIPTDKIQHSSLHPIPRHSSNSPAPSIAVHGVPMAARQLQEPSMKKQARKAVHPQDVDEEEPRATVGRPVARVAGPSDQSGSHVPPVRKLTPPQTSKGAAVVNTTQMAPAAIAPSSLTRILTRPQLSDPTSSSAHPTPPAAPAVPKPTGQQLHPALASVLAAQSKHRITPTGRLGNREMISQWHAQKRREEDIAMANVQRILQNAREEEAKQSSVSEVAKERGVSTPAQHTKDKAVASGSGVNRPMAAVPTTNAAVPSNVIRRQNEHQLATSSHEIARASPSVPSERSTPQTPDGSTSLDKHQGSALARLLSRPTSSSGPSSPVTEMEGTTARINGDHTSTVAPPTRRHTNAGPADATGHNHPNRGAPPDAPRIVMTIPKKLVRPDVQPPAHVPTPLTPSTSVSKATATVAAAKPPTTAPKAATPASATKASSPAKTTARTRNSRSSSRELEDDGYYAHCYICHDTLNPTAEKGCCASCPRVYHGSCHVPAIKVPFANLPDDWKCTLCCNMAKVVAEKEEPGPQDLWTMCRVVMECFKKQRNAFCFYNPVNDDDAPGYREVVEYPMCFRDIAARLANTFFDLTTRARLQAKPFPELDEYRTVDMFFGDMNLIFINCSTYNQPDSEIAIAGRAVWDLYQQSVKRHMPGYNSAVWLYITKFKPHKIVTEVAEPQLAPSSAGRVSGSSASSTTTRKRRRGRPPQEPSSKRPARTTKDDGSPLFREGSATSDDGDSEVKGELDG